MAATIPTKEPDVIFAGDTLRFDKSLPDYSASDGWSLTYYLNIAGQSFSFSSTASGNDHSVTVSKATTSAWVPGNYTFTGYAVSETERAKIFGPVTIEVKPDFANSTEDPRSHDQICVDLIRAAMKTAASRGAGEVQAEGVVIRWRSFEDLKAQFDHHLSQVQANSGKSRRVLTRFSRTR